MKLRRISSWPVWWPTASALRWCPMDLLLRLDVQILQIARPSWEREFYLIHDSRAYQSPAARSFRAFILDGVAL